MFKRTAIVSKDSLALAFVESALPFSLILEFAKIHLFLNLSNSLFILFVCKNTPSKCNLFARCVIYLFFSVFYSLSSDFIKLVESFICFYCFTSFSSCTITSQCPPLSGPTRRMRFSFCISRRIFFSVVCPRPNRVSNFAIVID